MVIPKFPIIILFIFPMLLPFSNGSTDEEYRICSSPSSCGPIENIRYPFWVDNFKPQFCGFPGFNLNCYNTSDYPQTDLGTFIGKCKVLGINTSSHSLVVERDKNEMGHAIENQPVVASGNDSNTFYFKLGPSVANITLFYGCPNNTVNSSYEAVVIPCPTYGVDMSLYYLDEGAKMRSKCPSNVTFPVSKRALDEFLHDRNGLTLEGVLDTPFEVEYEYVSFEECFKCRNSSGVCGSSEMYPPFKFLCFHPDPNRRNLALSLGLASAGIGLCSLILAAFCLKRRTTIEFSIIWKGKPTIEHLNIEANLRVHGSFAPRRYSYASIRKMTTGFKEKLGEGGYAVVYKGQLSSNGQPVAVKLLKKSRANNGAELINEVASMGTTNHVNVLKLLGFCFEGNKRALVYEFMPNGSLDKFTHGNSTDHHQPLPMNKIFDIALGIARGLDYLHRGCNTRILHFDIKPHNILLDEEFRPKISDFGLARLCPQKESTISMLEARGTIGYIAPEVFCRNFGGVSHKSDVYSYGMMVLDLVCGTKGNSTYVSRGEQSGSEFSYSQLIYQRVELGEKVELSEVMDDEERELQKKMILVSLWCIQTYPSNRPSINKVVEMLEGSVKLIEMPPKPFLNSPPRLVSDSSILPIL